MFASTKPLRQLLVLYTFVAAAISAVAQTMPVGTPFFADELRRAQLMGRINSDISFTIQPLLPAKAAGIQDVWGGDTVFVPFEKKQFGKHTAFRRSFSLRGKADSTDTLRNDLSEQNLRLELLPALLITRYNQHHPYGWSDGPMVPAKGLQQYVSVGIFARVGLLEMQLRPEFVFAQNKPFQNPPVRPRDIDAPERMGQDPYQRFFPGQSYIRLNLGPVSTGFSTENLWYGPGLKNSIILTNNAPGFLHFSLMTNRPFKTPIGTFEGHMAAGRLHRSGFRWPLRYADGTWPPVAGDVLPDTVNGTKPYGFVNTMALSWQPKWLPGLFLGATRVVQAIGAPKNTWDYFRILYYRDIKKELLGQPGITNTFNRNQIISLFFRYLFLKSNSEIWLEIGREDFWFDFQDLLTRLTYSTAYNAGFRKLYLLNSSSKWIEISGEYTKIQAPFGNFARASLGGYSFYTHSTKFGWAHYGQVMGAGIGPGSNMMTFGLRHGKGFRTFGLHFERVVYNEDLFYTAIPYLRLGSGTNPFYVDVSKHFVDWGFLLSHHNAFGRFTAGFLVHILKTYNFQWNYDPNGQPDPFRFPGINPWSVNGELSLMYRF